MNRMNLTLTCLAIGLGTTAANAADFFLTPANNLQAAINQAAEGDRLVLGPGLYNDTVTITKALTIEGAGVDETEISGAFLGDTVIVISGVSGDGVTIKSLTISNGTTPAGGGNGIGYPADGGGISVNSSVATIEDCKFVDGMSNDEAGALSFAYSTGIVRNCEFSNNHADGGGGALYAHLGSLELDACVFELNTSGGGGAVYINCPFEIRNTVFTDNSSTSVAGGLRLLNYDGLLEGCTISGNSGTDGGAIYATSNPSLIVRSCDFNTNMSTPTDSDGGAIRAASVGLTIEDSTFTRNTSGANGGAIYKDGSRALNVSRTRFHGNASTRGGGVRSTGTNNFDHCEFVGNSCTAFGGALYLSGSTTNSIRHCTMFANQGPQPLIAGSISSGSSDVRNCLAFGMPASLLSDLAWTSHAFRYCNIQQLETTDVYPGTGNVNEEPAFVSTPDAGADMTWGTADDDYGDLRLVDGSGGIDKGDSPSSLDLLVDLAGASRCVDDPATANAGVVAWTTCVDMGAYEFQPTGSGPTCPGDVNGDAAVDFTDLTELLENWGNICTP